jgi:hypothetical protein
MRWRQVGLLYVVATVLGAEYVLVEHERSGTQQTRPTRARFLDLSADVVREIRLHHGGRRVVTRRTEGRWAVTDPPDSPIPSDLVTAFVEALMGAEEIERVATGTAQASSFGLDDTAARVELLRGDGATLVVTLGTTNPTGTAVYARRGDKPEVILIGRNVRYYEDLIFQALPAGHVPAADGDLPVG